MYTYTVAENIMTINYKKAQSDIKPDLIDDTSSATVVYVRKNIVAETKTNEVDGATSTTYTYDEAKLTKDEYERYLSELNVRDIQQQRADIDYIALMLGIDLEV